MLAQVIPNARPVEAFAIRIGLPKMYPYPHAPPDIAAAVNQSENRRDRRVWSTSGDGLTTVYFGSPKGMMFIDVANERGGNNKSGEIL